MTRQKVKTTILMSYVQIYCERIFDLLDPEVNSSNLLIREDPERGVFIEGAACFPVTNVQECLKALEHGNTNRAVASTTMNAHSSRSHAVIILRIERKHYPTAADETMNNINKAEAMEAPQLLKISHLYLVDLAGSERVKKTNVYGRHVEELKAINLSLSALGNCISALSKQQKHIPYRDSKL
jgi:kinesin family protein 5